MQDSRLYQTPIGLTEGRIDRLLGDGIRDELMWALRPRLKGVLAPEAEVSPTRARKLFRSAKRTLSSAIPRRQAVAPVPTSRSERGPWVDIVDGVVRIWGSENLRIAVGAAEFNSRPLPISTKTITIASEVSCLLDLVRSEFPHRHFAVDNLLRRTAVTQARIQTLLDAHRVRTVVVGSTEHTYARLLIAEARRRGIPSVYVPHAPAATNRIYADLPADYSLLGYTGDARYYAALGAVNNQMPVIGDPFLNCLEQNAFGDSVVVFATTAPWARCEAALRRTLQELSRSLATTRHRLLVAPHPRDRTTSEAVARSLSLQVLHDRTETAFYRYRVAGMITERASGSAILAARRGVPVVRWSEAPNFVFEESLGVGTLEHDYGGLEAFIAALDEGPARVSPKERDLWSGPVGKQATVAREDFLAQQLRALGPSYDSWEFWRKR